MSTTTPEPGIPRLLTLYDVAEATHQSYATVLAHVTAGRLATFRPGGTGRHLVTEEAFRDYLSGGAAAPA